MTDTNYDKIHKLIKDNEFKHVNNYNLCLEIEMSNELEIDNYRLPITAGSLNNSVISQPSKRFETKKPVVKVLPYEDVLFLGDCEKSLKLIPSNFVDLIVTSPPYADQRKNTYGGIHPDKYVEWFLPKSREMLRVLKPTGSFILNIKERVVDGERHTYVMELIIAMKKQGWRFTEEYIWHKKNCYPGKWPNRFRDAWERCLHFTKEKKFIMNQSEVMVPTGTWKESRLKNLSETDKIRDNSKVGSGFGKKIENWVGRDLAYPTNVLHLATECSNKSHSAAFPKGLPEWFIKLLTNRKSVVLDPFAGSGTTLEVAKSMDRSFIGIEIQETYCDSICKILDLKKYSFKKDIFYAK